MPDFLDEILDVVFRDAISNDSGDNLDLNTAKAISQTNKQFRRVALPWMYRDIVIDTSKKLESFYTLLCELPGCGELVRSFKLNSSAWITTTSDQAESNTHVTEAIAKIASIIGPGLTEFFYWVDGQAFTSTSPASHFIPLVRQVNVLHVRLLAGSPDQDLSILQSLLDSAEKVETFILDCERDAGALSFSNPRPLRPGLKRLEVNCKFSHRELPSHYLTWLSGLNSLEKLMICWIAPDDSCVQELVQSFRTVGENIRDLTISTVNDFLPGSRENDAWVRSIMTIVGSCTRLETVWLYKAFPMDLRLFDDLPSGLKTLRCRFSFNIFHESLDEFIAALKNYVSKKNGNIKEIDIVLDFHSFDISDENRDIEEWLKENGVEKARVGCKAR